MVIPNFGNPNIFGNESHPIAGWMNILQYGNMGIQQVIGHIF